MKFDKDKRKKTGAILITIGVTALLCIGLFCFFGANLIWNPNPVDGPVSLEPDQNPLGPAGNDQSIAIPGFETMTIASGKTNVSAHLYNPVDNACYFEISIILNDGNEEIYKSNLISPGQQLYTINIAREMNAGTYEATLHYSVYSLGDQSPMNGANVPITLIAQ